MTLWQPYNKQVHADLPGDLASWLLDTGSLSKRLRDASGIYHLKLIQQGWQIPSLEEQQKLELTAKENVLIRKSEQWCNDDIRVIAHCVFPKTLFDDAVLSLSELNDQPLGKILFSSKDSKRDVIEIAKLAPSHSLLQSYNYDTPLWARRSVFHFSNHKILLTEVFTPLVAL